MRALGTIATALAAATAASALSSPRGTSLPKEISPWSPSRWRLIVDIGREPATAEGMPPEWGASGARLVLPIDLSVESDAAPTPDDVLARGGGGRALILRTIRDPTFVNRDGEQTVPLLPGGWTIALPTGPPRGHAATLEFWLDVDSGGSVAAQRNDVSIPPGRLYFSAPCWRAPELERGSRAIRPLVEAAKEAQRILDVQLSHESGDRRLDGVDPIDTVMAYGDMAKLVGDRDEKRRRLKEAEKVLPRNAEELPLGRWPGNTDLLAVGRGTVTIRRKKLFGDDFFPIGKWRASAIDSFAA